MTLCEQGLNRLGQLPRQAVVSALFLTTVVFAFWPYEQPSVPGSDPRDISALASTSGNSSAATGSIPSAKIVILRNDLQDEFHQLGLRFIRKPETCEVSVRVDEQVSHKLDCTDIALNQWTFFEFPTALGSGQKTLSLQMTPASSAPSALAIETVSTADTDLVAPRLRKRDRSPAAGLLAFMKSKTTRGGIYALCILGLMGIVFFTPNVLFSSLAILSTVWLGAMLSAPTLSGYDETAHLDMFFHESDSWQDAAEKNTKQLQFYKATAQVMQEDEFFLLHDVFPQPAELCPHYILYRCGLSPAPRYLYSRYQKALGTLGIHLDQPREFLWAGRLLNLFWLCGLVGFLGWAGGSNLIKASTPLLLAAGCILAQLPSITNDFPLLCLGFGGAGLLAATCLKPLSTRLVSAWALWLLLFSQAYRIDRSWLAGFVVIGFAGLLAVVSRQIGAWRLGSPVSSDGRQQAGRLFALAVGMMLLTIVSFAAITNLPAVEKALEGTRLWHPLLGVNTFNVNQHLALLTGHAKSFLGTFIWGHAPYLSMSYLFLSVCLLMAAWIGMSALDHPRPLARRSIFLTWGIFAGAYFIMIVAVAQHFYKGEFGPHLASARFTALAMGIPLFFPLLGCIKLTQTDAARPLVRWAALWGFFLLLVEFPKLYLAPIY